MSRVTVLLLLFLIYNINTTTMPSIPHDRQFDLYDIRSLPQVNFLVFQSATDSAMKYTCNVAAA